MKYFLASGIPALLLFAGGLIFLSAPIGHTQIIPTAVTSASGSDFAAAVQTGMQALASNPVAQTEQQQIQNQDYKSTWDEFGTNVMVDGNTPLAEINHQVVSDIAQSAEAAQNYNQQEASYLQAQQMTPEQVQSLEQTTGIDLLPTQEIDPNPSITANPDVNMSPADVSMPENNASSSETEINDIYTPTSTGEIPLEASTTEVNTSSSMMTVSSGDATIFDAILQGEQSQPATSIDTTTTSPDIVPSDTAPVDTAPSPDTATPAP